jgi:osmotically inducible protein OsmC
VPRIRREATVAWEGSLSRGSGVVGADTSGAFSLPFTLASRIADPGGKTSPEELLAAAHACCFTSSLAGEVARAGGTVVRLDVTCEVTLDEVEGGHHRIVASSLDAHGKVEGLDADGFRAAAEAADSGCPFSALVRASASVSVAAELATT